MWSKNGRPVETSAFPLPRATSTRILVSDVCRTTTLMGQTPFQQPVHLGGAGDASLEGSFRERCPSSAFRATRRCASGGSRFSSCGSATGVLGMFNQLAARGALGVSSALLLSTYAIAVDNPESDRHHRPLLKARQKIFGIENVNSETGQVREDRVIFSWLTNTTYAVSLKGR